MSEIIKKQIDCVIKNMICEDNALIVLKGIPLNTVDLERPDLALAIDDRLSYFMKIIQKGQHYISYEEFVLLFPFILSQFQSINIIENNLFINLFPLYQDIDQQTWSRLKTHFDQEDDIQLELTQVGDLSSYTELFTTCIELDGLRLVSYQEEPMDDRVGKIHRYQLFDQVSEELERQTITENNINQSEPIIEINTELDYVKLVRLVLQGVDQVTVIDQLSELDPQLLARRLAVLSYYWQDDSKIILAMIQQTVYDSNHYPECKEILKKHWGVSEFRSIKVYDLQKLENKEKVIRYVSQEQIISTLIEEVEKSQRNEHYRDLFVTAPTGSGKSVMFQIPAIYLAEKHQLMTIVISPLIGLMNDQITGLTGRNYHYARTIHSDISPVVKQDIMNEISENRCHLLYISPETLLSRSDISQLIGPRRLGMLVIDEAHIVTTWGKQFRPDYWYLGDYVSKLRQTRDFVIATFTATAIYGGLENMYVETKQSLRMVSPITWLGYMKRDDIEINIDQVEKITNKTEYELNKFDSLVESIKASLVFDKKTLIYFPTVALINRFYDYCIMQELGQHVVRYHGQMKKTDKIESYEAYLAGQKKIMLATKAFGMGIDIDDIEVIIHFAPTGNVCDYVQEIGRAARRKDLQGQALYKYMSNDFKHINRLHGLSTIQKYQLVQVIEKVYELYTQKIRNISSNRLTRRQNSMLIDAESFSYIFEGPMGDQDDAINKVKSAMLMIQKDFESRFGFAPFYVRPIPLFSQGYFQISEHDQRKLNIKYPNILTLSDATNNICMLDLSRIWEKDYKKLHSFPQFKYLLYTKDPELKFNLEYPIEAALCVSFTLNDHYADNFSLLFESFRLLIINCVREGKYFSISDLSHDYAKIARKSIYFAKNVCEVMLAAINVYMRNFNQRTNARFMQRRELQSGEFNYRFEPGIDDFFRWVEQGYKRVLNKSDEGKLYVVNNTHTDLCREITTQLGVLETLDILSFEILGGANSQLYIYVNQTLTLKRIIDRPGAYQNRLLTMINDRHNLSVEMLSYLFESKFDSKTIWDYLENYFLGIIPDKVKSLCEKKHQISFENID